MAYNGTKPLLTDLISLSDEILRENFRAIKEDKIVKALLLNSFTYGNSANNLALSNGTVCTNLVTDMLDSYHASNVANNIPISNGTLSSGLNAEKFNSQASTYYTNASNIYAGTLSSSYLPLITPTKGGIGLTSYNLGDLVIASATNTLATLAGNTVATQKFLTQTGNGSASVSPSWNSIVYTDVTDLASWTGTTNIVTLGTINSGVWHGGTISSSYLPIATAGSVGIVGIDTNTILNNSGVISLKSPDRMNKNKLKGLLDWCDIVYDKYWTTNTIAVGVGPVGNCYIPTVDKVLVTNFTAGTAQLISSAGVAGGAIAIGTNLRAEIQSIGLSSFVVKVFNATTGVEVNNSNISWVAKGF